MKMSDVQVGMRLRPTLVGSPGTGRNQGLWSDITVTELTERGFKYRINAPVESEGHEHFGYGGEAFYEPVSP